MSWRGYLDVREGSRKASKDREMFSRWRDRGTTVWVVRDQVPVSSGAYVLPVSSPPRGGLTSCRPTSLWAWCTLHGLIGHLWPPPAPGETPMLPLLDLLKGTTYQMPSIYSCHLVFGTKRFPYAIPFTHSFIHSCIHVACIYSTLPRSWVLL